MTEHLDPTTSLICRVQNRLCALPLAALRETLRPLPVQALATPIDNVLGLARVRGESLPVLDLAALLGLADPHPRRWVVLQVGARRAAVAVAEVLGLRTVPAHTLGDLPPLLRDARHAAIEALAWRDAELLAVLDAGRLLPDDERAYGPAPGTPQPPEPAP